MVNNIKTKVISLFWGIAFSINAQVRVCGVGSSGLGGTARIATHEEPLQRSLDVREMVGIMLRQYVHVVAVVVTRWRRSRNSWRRSSSRSPKP